MKSLLAGAAALVAMASPALGVGNVVISQIWGGNSTNAALPAADYVELFNRSNAAQNLGGWSVSVSSATGTAWTKLDLPAFDLQPGQYFLIQVSAASAGGLALPTPDATFSPAATILTTTSAKVALRNSTTAIGANLCITDATVVDLVTSSTSTTATCFEGAGRAPTGSSTVPGLTPTRVLGGCTDTDNNNTDFVNAVPNPRNSSSATTNCNAASGACCNVNTGACSLTAGSAACTGTYQGDNSTCDALPCPEVRACCSGTTGTTCTLLTAIGCTNVSGFWQGAGSVCSPTPCATASCCLPNGTCCALQPSLCASQGGTTGTGSCTALGNCIAAPTNDTCATATVLSAGTVIIGNNFAATGEDGLNTNCSTVRANKGVWYTFTPTTTSTYDISTCGTTFDNILGVWTIPNCADLSTWVAVACDDDGCPTQTTSGSFCSVTGSASGAFISNLQLTAGVTYHILLAADSTSTTGGGNFTLTVSDTGVQPVGACCTTSTGVCWITTLNACTAVATPVGTYQGDGSVCSPSPCGGELGACCVGVGVCVLRTAANCTGTLVFQGVGTSCGPNPCITGSCCNSCTFACTVTLQENCAVGTGTWTLDGVCTPTNPCTVGAVPSNDEPTGAIVLTLGTQVSGVNVNATDINDGALSTCDTTVSRGVWFSFTPATTTFYQFATCGSTHDTVLTVFDAADLNNQIACDADTCVGGTTDPSGCGTTSSSTLAARIDFVLLNAGTQYLVRVQSGGTTTFGTYVLVVNTTSAGACCVNATGACSTTSPTGCSTTTSTYQGDGTLCSANPCPASGSCCNPCTFACTLTTEATCASGSVWTVGATCTPNLCGGAAPANDGPCGAIVLTAGATVTANNASASSADDGPASTCGTAGSKGVWYSFTPATSGDYTITTCGATFDSLLAIFSGDCADPLNFTQLACDDDACLGSTRDTVVCGTGVPSAAAGIITSVALVQGTTYFIRVSVDSATAIGGTFPLTVRSLSTGSCCLTTGGCSVVVSELCANTNTYLPGTACGPTDCPAAGACCDPCGICAVTFASVCVGGATYQGDNTVCGSVTCPGDTTTPPANDNCVNATVISSFPYLASGCSSGATGDGPIGTCQSFGAPPSLLFSVWYKYLATQPGTLSVSVDFVTWRGNRLALVFATADGSCPLTNTDQVVCGTTDPYSTTIQVTPGTTYFIAIADEGTIATDEGGFYTLSVNFTGNNVVCCRGVTCAVIPAGDCTAPAGVGVRTVAGSSCVGQAAIDAGCCYADFNKSGIKDVADIFAYLSAWFANSPFSDVGGDGTGTRDVSDIFQFLSAWFAGCT